LARDGRRVEVVDVDVEDEVPALDEVEFELSNIVSRWVDVEAEAEGVGVTDESDPSWSVDPKNALGNDSRFIVVIDDDDDDDPFASIRSWLVLVRRVDGTDFDIVGPSNTSPWSDSGELLAWSSSLAVVDPAAAPAFFNRSTLNDKNSSSLELRAGDVWGEVGVM
jgi:hypothetical protein